MRRWRPPRSRRSFGRAHVEIGIQDSERLASCARLIEERGDQRSREPESSSLGNDADVDECGRLSAHLAGESIAYDVGRERGDDAVPLERRDRPDKINCLLVAVPANRLESEAKLILDGLDERRHLTWSKGADLAGRATPEPQASSAFAMRRRISKITSSEWLASSPWLAKSA